ncbi:MAG: hypothetical protein PUK40_05325 [Actinomycetaceae bacterium]|nr:hypothetical protein [Arcanobacterium sp.]MDD7505352.1 hypothetical protein [Actinomycetaceae bacterium]MDY6143129.1 hypothetical protein [Arcanobacterium sp.]
MAEDYERTAVSPAEASDFDTDGTRSERTLIDILDELTQIVTEAKNVPLSSSIVVNRTEVLDLLETARAIAPEQLLAADSMLADAHAMHDSVRDDSQRRLAQAQAKSEELAAEAKKKFDDLISQAQDKADGIIARAREEANRLVAQDSVTQAAKAEAKKIVDFAQAKAQKVATGANQYSDSMLENLGGQLVLLQDHIDDLLQQIDAGRNVLAERSLKQERSKDRDAQRDAKNSGDGEHTNRSRRHKTRE